MPSTNLQEKTQPAVWSEKGSAINFSDLKEGYLIKIHLDNANLPETEPIGVYRGIKDSEGVQNFVLETEGRRLKANTAGRMCESQIHEYYLPWVKLVEILARDAHAVVELFHAIGVPRVYQKNCEDRIKQAQRCLENRSKLNLIGQ